MAEITGETVVQAEVPAQSVQVAPVPITTRPVQHQQSQSLDPSVPAKTTFEEDLVTAGQRKINLIWESTQAAVTVLISAAAIFCGIYKIDADVINFAFVAVVSTYYTRTNHTKVGGVSLVDPGKYQGR